MAKNPAKRDPRKQGLVPLAFDNGEELSVNILSDDEKCEVFLSKYMERVDPIGKYPAYFENSGLSLAHLLKNVKQNYRTLVLLGKWSEVKFVAVTTEIISADLILSPFSYDRLSRLYEAGELESQRQQPERRRRRI